MPAAAATTAIILCGGRATRLGGAEKPLLRLGAKTLLEHVVERVHPQVDAVLLSCAKATEAYEALGFPVVEDMEPGQGPLGGYVSARPQVTTPWVLTTPADTPFIPPDLLASLAPTCRQRGAAVVTAGGRRQNLTMLLDAEHADSLAAYYRAGGRAIHRWLVANAVAEIDFPEAAFLNVNTAEDLAAADRLNSLRSNPL